MGISFHSFALIKTIPSAFVVSRIFSIGSITDKLIVRLWNIISTKGYFFLFHLVNRNAIHIPAAIRFQYIYFRKMMSFSVKCRIISIVPAYRSSNRCICTTTRFKVIFLIRVYKFIETYSFRIFCIKVCNNLCPFIPYFPITVIRG